AEDEQPLSQDTKAEQDRHQGQEDEDHSDSAPFGRVSSVTPCAAHRSWDFPFVGGAKRRTSRVLVRSQHVAAHVTRSTTSAGPGWRRTAPKCGRCTEWNPS